VNAVYTSNLGFNFTSYPFYSLSEFPDNNSHYFIDTVVTASDTWTYVASGFTADSNYTHFHIGNFYTDEFTNTETTNGSTGYYLIDNVSITPDLVNSTIVEKKELLSLFPNPAVEEITLKTVGSDANANLVIYNTVGSVVVPIISYATKSEIILDISSLKRGVYFIKYTTPKITYYEKFIKI
jgi:hypothetical protein